LTVTVTQPRNSVVFGITAGTGDFRGAIAPWLDAPTRARAANAKTVEKKRIREESLQGIEPWPPS
jgi:hypothetical protein